MICLQLLFYKSQLLTNLFSVFVVIFDFSLCKKNFKETNFNFDKTRKLIIFSCQNGVGNWSSKKWVFFFFFFQKKLETGNWKRGREQKCQVQKGATTKLFCFKRNCGEHNTGFFFKTCYLLFSILLLLFCLKEPLKTYFSRYRLKLFCDREEGFKSFYYSINQVF